MLTHCSGILPTQHDGRHCTRHRVDWLPTNERTDLAEAHKVNAAIFLIHYRIETLDSRDPSFAFTSGQWMTEVRYMFFFNYQGCSSGLATWRF